MAAGRAVASSFALISVAPSKKHPKLPVEPLLPLQRVFVCVWGGGRVLCWNKGLLRFQFETGMQASHGTKGLESLDILR